MKKIINLFILTMCLIYCVDAPHAATVMVGNDTTTAGARGRSVSLELKDDDLSNYKMVTFKLSLSGTAYANIDKVVPNGGQNYSVENEVYKITNEQGLKAGIIGVINYNTTDLLADPFTITPTEVKFYSETDTTIEGINIIDGKVISGTIKYEKPKSTDASLTELSVSQGTLTPAFNKDITEYKVVVPDTISIIRLSASAALGATRTGTGSKTLNLGDNFFSIEVTAEDGVTKKTYNVTITRGKATEPSAYIKSLKINDINAKLSPEFDSKNDKYTALVPAGTESLDLIYELEDPLANVSIEGNEKFVTGENKVTIKVTSSDNEKKQTYEILVTVEEEESTTTTTVVATPKKEEKKSNKWLLIVIAAAIVIIVAIVAFLLFRKKKDDNKKVISKKENNPSLDETSHTSSEGTLYDSDKTETYDSSLFKQELLKENEEELEKTKEFNFRDM